MLLTLLLRKKPPVNDKKKGFILQEEYHLKDYTPCPWCVNHVELIFDIEATRVLVTNTFNFCAKTAHYNAEMCLDGLDLKLHKLTLNGEFMGEEKYNKSNKSLTLLNLPAQGTLSIQTEIDPYHNDSLEGLYASNGLLCSQNEPEGFRRITYFFDRPDVMTIYTTTLIADRNVFPVLLSNGNLISEKEVTEGRVAVVWHDPFPKPSYLFALVAGNLVHRKDSFTTCTGREIDLKIYTRADDYAESEYALSCLKKAMKWDEEKFGREYDLDLFMIVAVNDFNAGAMENKGLNIFNASRVLASPQTATDTDYKLIDRIIAHEYFHNWTGNRITCKNWFQLTLKEGLTMYRDAEYTADLHSQAVCRIQGVKTLRGSQFLEDAGPLAHPIRPEKFVEINNFYTSTVYSKGEEVIRMLEVIIGKEKFRDAMDLYFLRYDGQAISTEDFLSVFTESAGLDLTQFKLWYSQAGTPKIEVKSLYNAQTQEYTLTFEQNCRPTAECQNKKPFYIPILLQLFNTKGEKLLSHETLFILNKKIQSITFKHISSEPIPSLLRRFSAPVSLEYPYTDTQLITLMKYDDDSFSRYEATQSLLYKTLVHAITQNSPHPCFEQTVFNAWESILEDAIALKIDFSYAALALQLPSLTMLAKDLEFVDYKLIDSITKQFSKQLVLRFEDKIIQLLKICKIKETYQFNESQCAKRALSAVLWRLVALMPNRIDMLLDAYKNAKDMTSTLNTLDAIITLPAEYSDTALSDFYNKHQAKPLVINKYYTLQSYSRRSNLVSYLKKSLNNPLFDRRNPNNVNALIGGLISNLPQYHEPTGEAYAWVGEMIKKCDTINPQLSSGLARRALRDFERLPLHQKVLLNQHILSIQAQSNHLNEVLQLIKKGK